MLIKGQCGKKRLHVLIDTGSMHNFLNEQLAKDLQCSIDAVKGIWVEIANGQAIQCNSMCHEFQWTMQQQSFKTDVYLLPLEVA